MPADLTDRVILKTFLGQPLAAAIVDQRASGSGTSKYISPLGPVGPFSWMNFAYSLAVTRFVSIWKSGRNNLCAGVSSFGPAVSPHGKFPGWDHDHSSKLSPLSLHCRGARFPAQRSEQGT